jgi:hypothetical protein
MVKSRGATAGTGPDDRLDRAVIEELRSALNDGRDWATALVEAMAAWTAPNETLGERQYSYFIGGEAFDWLTLAERLCGEVRGLIPDDECERLLVEGRFPGSLDEASFKDLLGVDKYRGYLNYFYGVTVEEALQLAVESEVHKRHLSNGNQFQDDFSEEAFGRIYLLSRSELLDLFHEEKSLPFDHTMDLTENKEFTYWLFTYRVRNSDKARVASDTRKGLLQLQRMATAEHPSGGIRLGDRVDLTAPMTR